MNFGLIIIGDEIISGKRQDKHMAQAIRLLTVRGLQLAWCRYLGDEPDLIVSTLRETFAGKDAVFSFGGIGATPDDHTRACAARAADVELRLHPEAEVEIRARFGAEITPRRLEMGTFPVGSTIIPNSHNRIPGFTFKRHHFLPGFPQMAWPMMEWVLDHHYRQLHHARPIAEASIIIPGAGEGQFIDLMNRTLAAFPGVKVFSLPRIQPERQVELGARGDAEHIPGAIAMIKSGVSELGLKWAEHPVDIS